MPEVGDLVVTTVTRVEDYGAYVKLDEFSGIEGLVHISEISTTWVRNIREHARQGQKLVLKVLRVSSQRNQIDLSLRRVTGREKSGGLYSPLEEALDEGPEVLVKGGLSSEWAQAIAEVTKTKIRLERSKVRGTVAVTCHKPGGVEIIKQALMSAKKIRKPRGSEVKIYSIGSPKYRIEVEAPSFEAAEKTLSLAVEEVLGTIKKAGGEGRKLG